MRKALYLIGGSGFIGKNIVRILSRNYDITVFDKFIDDTFFSRYNDVRTVRMNLIDEKIADSFSTPDIILNLASIVAVEREISLFDELINSNLKILINLYERFKDDKNLKLFLQFGSAEEYGTATSPYNESMREEPNSPYALVKQLTTNTAMMLYRNYSFPTIVVRPGNLFGPGQNSSKFIPYVVTQLKQGKTLRVTQCEQKRDFIYIDDFVNAMECIINHYKECIGEIINVSSGISVSLREIIEQLRESLHSTSKIEYGALPYRKNEAMDLKCDTARIDQLLKKDHLAQSLNNFISSSL